MPSVSLFLSIKLIPEIGFDVKMPLNVVFLVLFFSTIIMPLISVLLLIKNKLVSTLEMTSYKERSLPLFIGCLWMCIGYYKIGAILPPILKAELICAIIITFFASVISKFWKISLHMLGVGGVVGVILGLNILFGGLLQELMLAVLCAGTLCWARINEKAHNYSQLFVGFLLGALIEFSGFLILQNYFYNFNLSL